MVGALERWRDGSAHWERWERALAGRARSRATRDDTGLLQCRCLFACLSLSNLVMLTAVRYTTPVRTTTAAAIQSVSPVQCGHEPCYNSA